MEDLFSKKKEQINEINDLLTTLQLRNRSTMIIPKIVPDGVITNCPNCGKSMTNEEFVEHEYVCPNCGFHQRLHSIDRLKSIFDNNDYEMLFENLPQNYLDFPDYKEKMLKAKENSKVDESIVCAKGKIENIECLVGVMDSYFMMGSMGSVCGEKITLLATMALEQHLPLIIFTCSGGARMQEGVISLFQMAKTSQAIAKLVEHELYISVLTDPTTGGVSASFASLADITLAEPGSLIGFAGKRVIEQTIKEKLPDNFQRAEFLLEKGYIDNIVERKDMKKTIALLLKLHGYK